MSEAEAAGASAASGADDCGGACEGAAEAARPAKRRRLGRKSSAEERGEVSGAGRGPAAEARGGELVAEMAELSASEHDDERSASDREVASEDD
eukprot:1206741-Pyramimonas_sp.AAC.1